MMKRDEVIAIIAVHREQLQEMGVKSLELFGSVARDEARPDSDVDFLVEFNRPVGLFKFIAVRLYMGREIKFSLQTDAIARLP
jgi:hypothetical protein